MARSRTFQIKLVLDLPEELIIDICYACRVVFLGYWNTHDVIRSKCQNLRCVSKARSSPNLKEAMLRHTGQRIALLQGRCSIQTYEVRKMLTLLEGLGM